MGSSISNNKNIDYIINDLGFTKENLTNELQEIYNKHNKILDDNKRLVDLNNTYNTILFDKNTKIIELENSIINYEKLLKNNTKKNIDYENIISQLGKDYNNLVTSKNIDLDNKQLLISIEKKRNIELTNKYQLSKINESIFKDHNNLLLKVNSKLLNNNDNKLTTINSSTTNNDYKINLNTQYMNLINNLEYHIKMIIGNQEFNVWIPDHYEKKLCENTILYILSILSK